MRTKVFWDVTLCHWVGGFNIAKETWYLHIKQQSSPSEIANVGYSSWTALPSKVQISQTSKMGNHSPRNTELHPKRLESPATLL